MRFRIGHKLQTIREKGKLTQQEIAELLGLSTSAYARLERNETTPDFEQITKFSQALDIPIQEFLPDTVVFHNYNHGRGAGVIFGNYIVNVQGNEHIRELEEENLKLKTRLEALEEQLRSPGD
jgi:transcriptional regulator with XRE-family HTH domain